MNSATIKSKCPFNRKMMKKNIHLLIMLFFVVSCFQSTAQLPLSPELAARLANKRKYTDIMAEVDHYYRSHNFLSDPKMYREYKKWNRWSWFAIRHLNEAGEVDYRQSQMFNLSK